MDSNDSFIKKMQTKINEWSAQIDKMKAKLGQVNDNVRGEYRKRVEEFQLRREAAENKIDELRWAGQESWEELKSEIENRMNALGEAANSVISRFKDIKRMSGIHRLSGRLRSVGRVGKSKSKKTA